MPAESRRLLVVDVAALGWELVQRHPAPAALPFRKAAPVFPAVTCTAQASFRTLAPPSAHGMVGNGVYHPELRRVMFWEQSAALVGGARWWDALRAGGRRVALLFWQQSLGESADFVLSPRPIHKHHGGMIQDCYSEPADLYADLIRKLYRPFDLKHYWGPLASPKAGDWITRAAVAVMENPYLRPDLVCAYLPDLDYDLQRFGPDSPQAAKSVAAVYGHLETLRQAAREHGYDFLFWGDYAMEKVTGRPVFPNRALRDHSLLSVRKVQDMAYVDLFTSAAFAVADHQVAHVHVHDPAWLKKTVDVLGRLSGLAQVLGRDEQKAVGLDHPRGGDLVLVAEPGHWFAYPWWCSPAEAPDYAGHVDIHNKPGYDPCELFFGWPPGRISRDPNRIRGTHGRVAPELAVAWSSSLPFAREPASILDLAGRARDFFME